jgi:hypothetical protein
MNLLEMAAIAKQHWREHYPEGYKKLKKNGHLESEAMGAAKLTMREIEANRKAGMSESQAWEAARGLFILADPLNGYDL